MDISIGSTFDFTINFPEEYDLSNAAEVWVTFKQYNSIVMDLTLSHSDFTVSENHINIHLTQQQTNLFQTGEAQMQTRVRMDNEEALVQQPVTDINILGVIKEGVI